MFVPVFAVAVFVAVYPFLWPDPVERSLLLFETRSIAMDVQAQEFPEQAITTRMEVDSSMRDALGRFSVTTQKIEPGLGDIELVVGLLGLVLFVGKIVQGGLKSPLALMGIIAVGQAVAIIAGIKVSFERYYLPIVLVLAICIGVFAGEAGALALRTVLKNRLDRSGILCLRSRWNRPDGLSRPDEAAV